jgi:predicted acylesterase/phospholipase RssA
MNIKNLVLSGGSSKGYSYIGVFKALEENNITTNINTIIGTSVGSIYATLFTMKYKYDDFKKYIEKELHIEDISIDYLFDNFGVYTGKEIIEMMEDFIKDRYNINITFRDLFNITNLKLIICVTNLNTQKIEYLSYENYPNMKILDAVRYAITIPFLFTSHKYNNNYFLDGAILENISFCNLDPNETLGILLKDNTKINSNIKTIQDYSLNLFSCLKNHIDKYDNKYKVIKILSENISVFDISLSITQKKYLIQLGYNSVINFFKKNN